MSLHFREEDSAKPCPLHHALSSAQLLREFFYQEGDTAVIIFHSATELVKLQVQNSNHPPKNEMENLFIILLRGGNEIKFSKEQADGKKPWCLTQRAACYVSNLESLEGGNTSLSPFQNMLKFPGNVGCSGLPTNA